MLPLVIYLDSIIQNKPVSISNTTNKLDTFMNIDDKLQYFSNPVKHNDSTTAPRTNSALKHLIFYVLLFIGVEMFLIL